jgi:3-methyladenine DNA glycosylase AlkD
MYDRLVIELEKGIDSERAERTAHYFGICPGGYAEKDIILGIPSPHIRRVAKDFKTLPVSDILRLLHSPIHEFRFCALAILGERYRKAPRETVEIYLDNLDYINNWDLVDCFASHIIGRWCLENDDETVLIKLNQKSSLWRRRISLVAYLAYYRKGILGSGLELIDKRLDDPEDLMHKVCGWMLREIYSKVDKHVIESYIIDNYSRMSRTTLRYAIEHMPEDERQRYLKGKF